jgi:hypothetical protein
MAHYAFINNDNIVTEVIVGIDETELIEGKDPETWYSEFKGQTCKRTSYNGKYRKNYAGIGFRYDTERDAFIPPKPFSKWILNEQTCQWMPPIAYPADGFSYLWNDNKGEWELENFAESNGELEA